jgi:acetyl esterase/lipase
MPLDPDAAQILEMVRLAGRPAFETVSAEEARALYRAGREVLSPPAPPVAATRDLRAPSTDGHPVPVRLYRGIGAPERAPALVYLHGGGWVVGDIETHETVCCHLANAARCLVVSVDYRMGPEHKFPAAVEDAFAALAWVEGEAAALGVDPARLAVGGDSAGGNLAAVVGLLARDRGGPRLALQALLYPATEAAMTHPSHRRFGEGHLLTRSTTEWFYAQYLRSPADAADWRVSPLRAADLAGVAPAYVLTCGYDPLCDEGDAYAVRLAEAGVPVQRRSYPDQIHGFLTLGKIVHAAGPALDEIAAALAAAFAAG